MSPEKIPVGIQLYSLRDVMPKDVAGTLRKVADMGYAGVEFDGYYNLSGGDLRKMLDDCNLICLGAHTGLDALEKDAFEKTVATNKALGTDRLIVPWADVKDLPRTIARLNAAYVRAKKCGMRVGYHNHAQEFAVVDDRTIFERIFAETPGDFLVQLDIGWASHAGLDVSAIAALLRKYADRVETVHVKEFSRANPTAAVGEGEVNWAKIFPILEKETAIQCYVVEQEKFAVGPLESARVCIDNIRKLGR
ncbi:MAG: sugar phosphate isomerase/epimerase [Kiritimatiellia bacterium]